MPSLKDVLKIFHVIIYGILFFYFKEEKKDNIKISEIVI